MKKMRFTHSMNGFLIYIALLFLPGLVVSQIEYGGEPFAKSILPQ
jgi:hypothetical protein